MAWVPERSTPPGLYFIRARKLCARAIYIRGIAANGSSPIGRKELIGFLRLGIFIIAFIV